MLPIILTLAIALTGCGPEGEEAKEGIYDMISDLTSSFANSTGAITHDYVTVATDRYDKDVIEDYDFSGLASVGYYDQEKASVSQKESYKVLVCDGVGEEGGKNSWNKKNAEKIFSAINSDDDPRDTLEEEGNRWSDNASDTDSRVAIAAANKGLYYANNGKKKEGENDTLPKIFESVANKITGKGTQYTRWDEAEGHSLPYALAEGKKGRYACVVFLTYALCDEWEDSGDYKECVRVRAYGKNAKQFAKTTNELAEGGPLKGKLKGINSTKKSGYRKKLGNIAKKLDMDVLEVQLLQVIRNGKDKFGSEISECDTITGKVVDPDEHPNSKHYYYTKKDGKEKCTCAIRSQELLKANSESNKVPMYTDVPNMIHTIIKGVYETDVPATQWSDGTTTSGTDNGENALNSDKNGSKDNSSCKKGHKDFNNMISLILGGDKEADKSRKFEISTYFKRSHTPVDLKTIAVPSNLYILLDGKEKKTRTVFNSNGKSITGSISVKEIILYDKDAKNYYYGASFLDNLRDLLSKEKSNETSYFSMFKDCESGKHKLIKLKDGNPLHFEVVFTFKSDGGHNYEFHGKGVLEYSKQE